MQVLSSVSALVLLFAVPALANPSLPMVPPGKLGFLAERLARGRTLARQFVNEGKYAGVIGLVSRKAVEEGKIVLGDPIEKYLPELGTRQILQGGNEERPILVAAKNSLVERKSW